MAARFYNQWEEQPGFGITIAISVCLHAIILTVIFLLSNSSSLRIVTAPVYTVDLLAPQRPAAIPSKADSLETQAKPLAEAEAKKGASKDVARERAVVLKKEREQSLDETLEKIQQRVKKREAEEAISHAIQGLENKQLEKRIKEIREKVVHKQGIVKSMKNSGLAQRGGALKRSEGLEEQYAQLIGDIIHDTWNYMGDIREGEVAVVDVRIDKNGRLTASHVERSSGNTLFVQSAVKAIERAASLFPPLPKELGKDFVEIGVCFPRCEQH